MGGYKIPLSPLKTMNEKLLNDIFDKNYEKHSLKKIIVEQLQKAINEDKWITIHPHGEDSEDYRRLLIKEGETVEDAMHRQGYYNKRKVKDENALKEEKKKLYQDILKAKKAGNKELHHKLLQRYNEIDAQLKGNKQPGQKQPDSQKKQAVKLAGVEKGKPMTWDNANNRKPNPKFGTENGCTSNCQTCVVAFEARLRGYNVRALGNYRNPDIKRLSHSTKIAWIDPKTGKHPEYILDTAVTNAKTCYSWLDKEIKKGNRYTIEFGWKGRRYSGHIVTIYKNEKNEMCIYDPQSGKSLSDKQELYEYMKRFKYKFSTYGLTLPDPPKLLRIDNLEFNTDVVDKILKKYD